MLYGFCINFSRLQPGRPLFCGEELGVCGEELGVCGEELGVCGEELSVSRISDR